MDSSAFNAQVKEESQHIRRIFSEVQKVIVGQREMLDRILIGLLTGGHVLLEGVPGLAKTLTISTVARTVSLAFQRIQFTPDLLPSDLIGTMIFHQKSGEFVAKKGPIFSNIVLADEINRAPAKVQSALLEAMAERQVTIGETTHPLPSPFLVLATQNPLEQEGTYPLPEAQMDRFMFKVIVNYPGRTEELAILNSMSADQLPRVDALVGQEDLLKARKTINSVYVDDKVKNYIVDLVMASRIPAEHGLGRLSNLIQVGGSPRATISLARASRAHAFLQGRGFVTADDVKAIAYDVLRHRLILTYEAEAENIKSDGVITEILSHVEVP
jgi:MoxR-like ATPase